MTSTYITGDLIRTLRENKHLTQQALAEALQVSDKAVSRWETGRGYPDITLLEPLASTLGVSVAELLAGNAISKANTSGNVKRSKLYVCPLCGNVFWSMGDASISCCGVTLPALEADDVDEVHMAAIEVVEDEYVVSLNHPMTKDHYISFIAALRDNRFEIVKLYPEGEAQAYFKINCMHQLFAYCNRHGLFRLK